MARFLCGAVVEKGGCAATVGPRWMGRCFSLQQYRKRSSKSSKAELMELEAASSSSLCVKESDEVALRRMEELIHWIVVWKGTPDWLPFVPGSSFWVPPPPGSSTANDVVHLVRKLRRDLSDEECLAVTSLRGCPSSSFYLQQDESAQVDAAVELNGPEEMGVSVEVKVLSVTENVAKSEDEES